MRPLAPLLLPLAALTALTAFAPLRAQQTPLPGPTFDERDIQVVRRGDKPPSSLGAKLAVVVGVNRYAKLSPLAYPEKDAKDLTTALQGLGFAVRTLTLDGQEPPFHAESILSVIAEVCRDADPTDTVLIALSGHGFSESGGKEGYFCAHYTDPEKLTATGLSLDEVRRRLCASPAKQRMLIVDACRNVPGERGASKRLEISEAFRAEGLGVLFSTAPGTVSQEPADGAVLVDARGRRIENGVFTHYLLRGLEGEADSNGDGWLTFRELAYHTWREVKGKTQNKQKPYLDWVGEAGGDFLLRQVPVRAVAGGPEVAPPVVAVPEPAAAGPKPPSGCKVAAGAKVVDGVWDRIEHEASGIVLRYVPPGEFTMGSPANEPDRQDNETQHRRVIEKGFYLGETEVTVGQWRRFAQASGYRTDAERGVVVRDNRDGGYTLKPSGQDWEWHADASWENPLPLLPDYRLEDQHPVVQISWNDASKFCQHHGLVLPSEAQWEWACRARSKTRYPWGAGEEGGERFANVADQAGKRRFSGWTRTQFGFDDGHALVAKVGSYEANRYGLKDMIGNVWEWCADGYQKDYPGDGATEAPAAGASRVLRGGSWYDFPAGCRAANRSFSGPALRYDFIGFRAARTL
jgi:sulfatase modifying factor 1